MSAPQRGRRPRDPRPQDGVLHDETSPLLPRAPVADQLGDDGALKPWSDIHSLWLEAKILCQYSLPLIATYLLQYSFTVITTVVAGHLSAEDLAASSLGLTTMNIVGFTIFEGMATALDTLCAQAYGSGRFTGVGLHIQRMIIFMTVVMLPVGAFWLCSHWILPLLVPQRTLALKAASFLRVSLVGLPGYAFFEAGKRFLQAQGDFGPGMVVLIICAPANAFLSWFFAVKMDMGLDGAAFGQALANNLRPALLLLHVVLLRKKSHRCWGGWDYRTALSVREWGPMVRLSVASTAVNAAEWLAFEILMVSSSYISTQHLAAQTILSTLSTVTWHVPFSISVAVTTRFGHLVGAGALKEARRAAVLYTVVFLVVGVLDGVILYVLRRPLSELFSEDAVVRDVAIRAMLTVSVFQIIDSVICGTNGVLRGLAKQAVAAWVVLVTNYLAAVPFAIWLGLGSPYLKLDGLWMGLGSGMVIIAVIECVYMKWINWQDCVDDAREREDDGT
ncbi:ethionine resistance [Fusarium albosuccineum]|uniref:Ethionine resistance n=1 Tax=Fusarium albosuccineum TaxID=1237068 RepID=A0A8H4KYI3_9HYPO|nr:ethionine resistance [Fusarium albosuccineum]